MSKSDKAKEIAHQLRINRREAGVTIREIDQQAYAYESTAVLSKMSQRELNTATRAHYNAVQEAADRKGSR